MTTLITKPTLAHPSLRPRRKKLGVNMTEYNSCITASTYLPKIEQQITDAESAGGNGTPFTVIINTKTGKQYPISGALPLAQIQSVINQAKASQ